MCWIVDIEAQNLLLKIKENLDDIQFEEIGKSENFIFLKVLEL